MWWQVYGFGKSEEFLAEFMGATSTSPIIATKYAPQPWRLTQGSVPAACKASLARLQLQQMGLYIQHWWVDCQHTGLPKLQCTSHIHTGEWPLFEMPSGQWPAAGSRTNMCRGASPR